MATLCFRPSVRFAAVVSAAATLLVAAPGCEPLGLGLPTTRELENGVVGGVNSASSLEVAGAYVLDGVPWSFDLQLVRPHTEHLLVDQGATHLEAIVIGTNAYFRGRDFLSQHLGSASAARTVVNAAGSAWWVGTASGLPDLSDFADGDWLKQTFLGPAATQRNDHVTVDGLDAAEFSGPRADVYIGEQAPHRLIRLHLAPRTNVDGMTSGDMHFSSYDREFGIAAPSDVIDFSNLSTLPPEYTVVSVDTSHCGVPCVSSAVVKNLGGKSGGSAPSTITFTMTDSASGKLLGSCATQIQPDVDYNGTATVSCTIGGLTGQDFNAAIVAATPDNPGHS